MTLSPKNQVSEISSAEMQGTHDHVHAAKIARGPVQLKEGEKVTIGTVEKFISLPQGLMAEFRSIGRNLLKHRKVVPVTDLRPAGQ